MSDTLFQLDQLKPSPTKFAYQEQWSDSEYVWCKSSSFWGWKIGSSNRNHHKCIKVSIKFSTRYVWLLKIEIEIAISWKKTCSVLPGGREHMNRRSKVKFSYVIHSLCKLVDTTLYENVTFSSGKNNFFSIVSPTHTKIIHREYNSWPARFGYTPLWEKLDVSWGWILGLEGFQMTVMQSERKHLTQLPWFMLAIQRPGK